MLHSPWSHTRNRMQTPKIKILRTLSRQPYGRSLCVEGGRWDGDSGIHRMLILESSNSTSLSLLVCGRIPGPGFCISKRLLLPTDPEVPGSILGHYKIKKLVGLGRGLLSRVSTNEELLGRKSSGSGLESREYGRRDSSRWPRDTLYPQKSLH
jgi:hypothetical protein